ncbi:MAG TPA: 50S ribosomal protein L11 methyltransferase [Steroidobacteraceae bacterium]|nr:50S ribosomal protein L11 methyltransferase [Steroidobacteraceae bacterium]
MAPSGQAFHEVSWELVRLAADEAEAACLACGAIAVTFIDADEREASPVLEPAPGEFRLWPAARIQALFPPEADCDGILRALSRALGVDPALLQAREVADRAWEREWLRDFHAMRFGTRLWVCPHHEQVAEPGAAVVRMDPGLAFGTGTHPTTALCLEWLDAHPPVNAAVVDFGCGSGVLALAALRLGARAASCFDIDPQALIATRDNAGANGLGDRVLLCDSVAAIPHATDLLLANILSGPLVELARCFTDILGPDGTLVLSGLMEHEVPEVALAYEAWFDMRIFGVRESWVCLWARRNGRARD